MHKVLRRVSGKESRSLWHELVQTQKELVQTQKELVQTQKELVQTQKELVQTQKELAAKNDRHLRVHPYIAEALNAIAPPIEVLRKGLRESEVPNSVFTKFGSDKDSRHSYGNVYQQIIKKFTHPRILEIGVGSVNDFPYAGLKPGGALKAFREISSTSTVVGIDIDPQAVQTIQDEGFIGFTVDQTSEESLKDVETKLSQYGPFDLIIDDGFHDPHANVKTLKILFNLLSDEGTYVVEDVHETLIDFWKVLSLSLPGKMSILDMRDIRPGDQDNILILLTKQNCFDFC
jgi:hypothetical protein